VVVAAVVVPAAEIPAVVVVVAAGAATGRNYQWLVVSAWWLAMFRPQLTTSH
jgi:hypothetical protein